jgi:hypothetical protein
MKSFFSAKPSSSSPVGGCGPAPQELQGERIFPRVEISFHETDGMPHSISVARIVALPATNTCLILPGAANRKFTRVSYQNTYLKNRLAIE